MIDIEFSKYSNGRARIWIDEFPPIEPLAGNVSWRSENFDDALRLVLHKRIAVELFQPFGAMFHYGLLGAELNFNSGSGLVVTMPIDTPCPKISYPEALVKNFDDVSIGSTPEFSSSVFSALRRLPSCILPRGRLDFTIMAHGSVGSAPMVFDRLASAIIRLFGCAEISDNEIDVSGIFDKS